MLMYVLYIVFFYFTHNLLYASSHFTGASKVAPILYRVLSIICLVLELVYIIMLAVRVSIWKAIILFIAAFVVLNVVKLITNHVVMKRVSNEKRPEDYENNKPLFWGYYNRQLDISASLHAFIGLFVNPIIIILHFTLLR